MGLTRVIFFDSSGASSCKSEINRQKFEDSIARPIMEAMANTSDRKAVLQAVFEAIAQVWAGRGRRYTMPQTLDPSMALDELGIDSISIAEVVDVLEQRFERELPFDQLILVQSVDEFIDVVCGSESVVK